MAAVTLAVHVPRGVFTGVWSKLVVQLDNTHVVLSCSGFVDANMCVRLRVVVLVEGLCDKPSAY
jgi:hypothetical protein